MKRLWKITTLSAALSLVLILPAAAAVIDFQDKTGPSFFASAGPAQTITYINVGGTGVDVTFTGGVVLTQTANLPANQTSVYGTAYFGDSSLTNPLTITFSKPITNFFMDLYNGLVTNIDYRVSDNAGHSADFTLVPNLSSGQTLVGFAATGTVVTVASITVPTSTWDFFIDNVHFDEDLPPGLNTVPEPSTMLLLGSGLVGLIGYGTRRFKK